MADDLYNFISLTEAVKFCNYSQEYLSLRARQGKLKAIKFGRNWVTKKEWLEEYLKKVQGGRLKVGVPKIRTTMPVLRFGFLVALVFVLLITGVVLGKESFKNVYPIVKSFYYGVFETLNPYVAKINKNLNIFFVDFNQSFENTLPSLKYNFDKVSEDFKKGVEELGKDLNSGLAEVTEIGETPGQTLKEYFSWLASQTFGVGQKIVQGYSSANDFIEQKLGGLRDIIVKKYLVANDFVEEKINQGYRVLTQLWPSPEKTVEEKLIPKPAAEGLVIIPSAEEDEKMKEKIKEAFSDEVRVEPEDKTSGIIIPIFREREGEKYLYILVPISN